MTLAVQSLCLKGRLDGIDAVLRPGAITAICGPNGAGKSTLLAALAGLVRPDSGGVTLDERALDGVPARERARAIGYLPQIGEVAWDLSVAGLAALGRLPHRDDPAPPVKRALAALDLLELADRPVSTLSGGELARALLARVLAGEPRWILADEPLAALDLAHQLVLLGHLRQAARDGGGVVLVVHDLALAMNHADRVLVLDRGRLAAQGPPEEALAGDLVADVWGVRVRWLGVPGQRALVIGGEPDQT